MLNKIDQRGIKFNVFARARRWAARKISLLSHHVSSLLSYHFSSTSVVLQLLSELEISSVIFGTPVSCSHYPLIWTLPVLESCYNSFLVTWIIDDFPSFIFHFLAFNFSMIAFFHSLPSGIASRRCKPRVFRNSSNSFVKCSVPISNWRYLILPTVLFIRRKVWKQLSPVDPVISAMISSYKSLLNWMYSIIHFYTK